MHDTYTKYSLNGGYYCVSPEISSRFDVGVQRGAKRSAFSLSVLRDILFLLRHIGPSHVYAHICVHVCTERAINDSEYFLSGGDHRYSQTSKGRSRWSKRQPRAKIRILAYAICRNSWGFRVKFVAVPRLILSYIQSKREGEREGDSLAGTTLREIGLRTTSQYTCVSVELWRN